MIDQPFRILAPFADRLQIGLFNRNDPSPFNEDHVSNVFKVSEYAGLHQEHKNNTLIVDQAIKRTLKGDGMVTDKPDLALCIRWADCQNFIAYAPKYHVAGVLHIGWRCLIHKAIAEFFNVMEVKWGIKPEEVYLGSGPSLCLQHAEFSNPTEELKGIDSKFFHGNLVDLQSIAESQLNEIGLPKENFEQMPGCTACNSEQYWTYRGGDREAVKQGYVNALCCCLKP